MLEFKGKRPILKNLTIEPIALSPAQSQELDKILTSEKATVYKHWTGKDGNDEHYREYSWILQYCGQVTNACSKISRFKSNY